jgi:hypothetical protein
LISVEIKSGTHMRNKIPLTDSSISLGHQPVAKLTCLDFCPDFIGMEGHGRKTGRVNYFGVASLSGRGANSW